MGSGTTLSQAGVELKKREATYRRMTGVERKKGVGHSVRLLAGSSLEKSSVQRTKRNN